MALDGKFSVNSASSGNELTKSDDINAKIISLANSIPEKTSTKTEKEHAIKVKNQIIELKKQLYNAAKNNGDTALAEDILNDIKIIEQEKVAIQSEIDAMTNIFTDSNDKNITSRKGPSIFS